MPASKVRRKAKTKVAAERKRLREQDRSCADSCCPGEGSDIAASKPMTGQISVPSGQDQP
jgi:hypothetical protein